MYSYNTPNILTDNQLKEQTQLLSGVNNELFTKEK